MKVLIACEESQVVCKAFRERGHEAYSCDILPCSGGHPEWHIQDDVMKHLNENWDMMIGHPECRFLANSGVCHLYNQDKSRNDPRWKQLESASQFFYSLWNAPIPKICLENPISHKYGKLPEYSQIIHPWQFGHMEQKPTCLWLKGLPKLTETNNVKEEMLKLPANKRQRIHYMPPSKHRARDRARTYQGIANAMADQWGELHSTKGGESNSHSSQQSGRDKVLDDYCNIDLTYYVWGEKQSDEVGMCRGKECNYCGRYTEELHQQGKDGK